MPCALQLKRAFLRNNLVGPRPQVLKRVFEHKGCILNVGGEPDPDWKDYLKKDVININVDNYQQLQEALIQYAPINICKINIKGLEYTALPLLKHPVADQLIIPFHDYEPDFLHLQSYTQIVLAYLSQWYDFAKLPPIDKQCYLFYTKNHMRFTPSFV